MPRLDLSEEDSVKMGKLITDAWRHAAIRKKLIVNPEMAMIEAGIRIPHIDQKRIVVLEDTKTTIHLILPVRVDVAVAEMESREFRLELGTKLFASCR